MNFFKVLLFLCCLAAVPAKAVISLSDTAEVALHTDIELRGSASIIVEYGGTSGLASLQGEARSASIQLMHQGFLDSLSEATAKNVTSSFSYVPGLVLSVNKEQLQEVRNSRLVKRIYQNKARRISLQQSVDIVLPSGAKNRFSGKGQAVAVLDTGVDRTHSVFTTNGANRVVSEACYSGGGFTGFREVVTLCPNRSTVQTGTGAGKDCTALSFPGCDHGTHVAGIAAGNDGVARDAEIIAVQIFTGLRDVFRRNICGGGVGQNCVVAFDSDIIKGLERVFSLRNTHKVAAVNMSLGGFQFSGACDSQNSMMTSIIGQLKTVGIATIIASGNNGFSAAMGFPACISNAIAVGATSDFTGTALGRSVTKDERVFYSNHSGALDLFAPGTLIRSSVPGNRFANFNGTSMATPHVAGAFAVVKARQDSLTVNEIESAFKSVGPNVSHSGVSRRRIDIVEALKALNLFTPPLIPVLSLLLSDSATQPPPPPPPPPTPPIAGCSLTAIAVGETISGVWTTSSPFSSNRLGGGASHSAPFAFELSSTSNVTIDVTGSVDTYLYLMQGCNASGTVIQFNDDGGVGLNSRIIMSLAAGVYTIDATTFQAGETGDYSVSLSSQ